MKRDKEVVEDKKEPEFEEKNFGLAAKAYLFALIGLGIIALIVWLVKLFR
ncbi:hypothetical protein [Roseivirga echinicomitans]|nr:hypothetical protein [Roseivirga echinicomitans]